MWYTLFLAALIWKFIDTLEILFTKMPHTPFGVMLITVVILPICITFKSAFIETSQEEQDAEWNFCGMLFILTLFVGLVQFLL